jgi:predicted ATPase/class 3 adenylate cyclase
MGTSQPNTDVRSAARLISTPDQRLRVFVSSTLSELAPEREAAEEAIRTLRLTPVMFELGAPPHPPVDLYRSYVDQSDVFVGIYWQAYGWVAPDADVSGIEDELSHSGSLPRLIYIKEPAPEREARLASMLDRIRDDGSTSYRTFGTAQELSELLLDDLAVLVTERFYSPAVPPELAEGTMTFFFADLEGSTPMIQRLGDDYKTLLRDYHAIVHASVSAHRGRTAATEGDGFFCVFASPIDAVDAARDVLVDMAARDWPGGEHPRCRIGIHTGTATRTMEGYVGLDVHRAARIGASANGGQVLVSASTATLLADHARARGWALVDLGDFKLEGIGQENRLLRIDMPELEQVTTPPRARARPRITLPTSPRPIVGRVADLAGATEMLLRDMVRLVTITGPGGTGKTRLAVEIAGRLDTEFPDGVVYVDLSAVRDPTRFLPAVGRAMGVRESAEREVIEGLENVVGAERMLVVLDNLEQLLDAAPNVALLLDKLPNVKILATSRSPLRLSWEHEYPLSPLPVPASEASTEAVAASDAVALFVERARTVRPGFDVDGSNAAVVAEITRRLDGLPLAIELAAARLRLFPAEVLLQRLDDRLGLLDKGASDAPERHRTLRAAIQWSHDLLDESEKVVFRRLAVFTGGWTLDAALEVCADEDLTDTKVLDVLDELVAKSLVVFAVDEQGRPRYRMLETLREFSAERLVEAGEEVQFRTRHIHWCHALAGRIMDVLPTPRFPPFLDEIEIERANIRSALNWSIECGIGLEEALTICGDLPLFWDTRGYVTEGVELTRGLVGITEGDTIGRGEALAGLGWLEMLGGEPDRSEDALSAAEQMFRDLGDDDWLGRTLAMHGMTTYNRNDLDAAERQFEEAIALTRAHGLEWLAEAWCGYGLAHIALARGDFETCQTLLDKALGYSRDHGLIWGVGHTQLSLGVLAFMSGDMDEAMRRLSESTKVRRELRDSRGICDCLGTIALLASFRGENEFAAQMLGAAEIAREASGHQVVPWLRPLLEQAQMSVQLALEEDYEPRLAEGRALATDKAIEMILERFQTPQSVGAPESITVGSE